MGCVGCIAVAGRMPSNVSLIRRVCLSLENLCNDVIFAVKIELLHFTNKSQEI